MIEKWLSTAWERYKENALPIIATLIILWVIFLVVAGAVGLATVGTVLFSGHMRAVKDFSALGPGLAVLLVVILLLSVYTNAARLVMYRDAVDGRVDIGKVLREGFQYYVPVLVALIIQLVAIGIPAALGIAALFLGQVGGILAVILWLVALYIALRLLWAPAYVVIRNVGGVEAVKQSWEESGKNFGRVLWYVAAFIILGIVGAVVSLIPVIGTLITLLLVSPLIGLVYILAAKG